MTARSGKQRRLEEPPDREDVPLPRPSSSKRPATRKSTDIWLIGHPSATIAGAKLPDCRQVMKYVMYLRNDPENIQKKVKNEDIAYEVVDNVIVFWNMARIKTKYRHNDGTPRSFPSVYSGAPERRTASRSYFSPRESHNYSFPSQCRGPKRGGFCLTVSIIFSAICCRMHILLLRVVDLEISKSSRFPPEAFKTADTIIVA